MSSRDRFSDPDKLAALQRKMQLAFDMHEMGVAAYGARLRRQHPEWTEQQVASAVSEWLRDPGPCPKGHRVVEWPR